MSAEIATPAAGCQSPLVVYHSDRDAAVWHGDALQGLPCECDALIVDAPYSEKCQKGHDASAGTWTDGNDRRSLDYAFWAAADVHRAIDAWSPSVRGWIVSITDEFLVPAWRESLLATGRYVFGSLPFLSPGSRCRQQGDGPSQWCVWIVVARPRHVPYSTWGTLPGGYCLPPERNLAVCGGKPLSLMKELVSDYSRPGDLICDPCCGAGTTGRAALDCGRRFVGVDISAAHCELTKRRLAQQVLL